MNVKLRLIRSASFSPYLCGVRRSWDDEETVAGGRSWGGEAWVRWSWDGEASVAGCGCGGVGMARRRWQGVGAVELGWRGVGGRAWVRWSWGGEASVGCVGAVELGWRGVGGGGVGGAWVRWSWGGEASMAAEVAGRGCGGVGVARRRWGRWRGVGAVELGWQIGRASCRERV